MSPKVKIAFRLSQWLLATVIFSTATFAQAEKKNAYAVLLDNTGSMRTQFPQVIALGNGVVRRIHRRGAVSLFHFETQRDKRYEWAVVTQGTAWSQSEDELGGYMGGLFVVPGQTPLLDAVRTMGEKLNFKASGEKDSYAGKAIILISDGEDRVSKVKEQTLIKELKESGIKVYAVGLIRELEADDGGMIRRSSRHRSEDFLRKITSETGGRVVFPKSKGADINQLLDELLAE